MIKEITEEGIELIEDCKINIDSINTLVDVVIAQGLAKKNDNNWDMTFIVTPEQRLDFSRVIEQNSSEHMVNFHIPEFIKKVDNESGYDEAEFTSPIFTRYKSYNGVRIELKSKTEQ